MVFSREYDEQYDLVLMETETGEEARLTHTPCDELSPVFVTGGEAIIYVSDQDGIFNLHRLDLNTSATSQLSQVVASVSR